MSKRKRFVLTSALLSLGFTTILLFENQFLDNKYRFWGIGALGLMTIILFVWSLREGLGKNMTSLALVLPFFYTIGVGLFWFLLPSNIIARVPVIVLYGLGIYTLCLTANIYTVAAIRTIALLRAARGVGFVLTLVTLFLLFDTILSLRSNFFTTSMLVMLTSFPLMLHGFWSIELSPTLSRSVLKTSLVSSFVLGEIAVIMYFWPVTVVVGSLFFTVTSYILLGLGQARLEGRLFSQTVREYLFLGSLVSIGMFVVTRWGA